MSSSAPHHKAFRQGTDRSVSPSETLERIGPLMAEFGITRVANVTGLDRVGVPVVAVVRPNSRSICVSQGKGLTLEAAQVSGLMESIESYHAEHAKLALLLGSARELARGHRLVDTSRLPRLNVSSFHEDLRLLWAGGIELTSGEPRLLPYELVHTDFRVPLPTGSGAFLMSSNGLASGNDLPEALSHAICELIERDANTLFQVSGPSFSEARRVDLRTVDDAGCLRVLARFEQAEIDIGVWETTSDIGVPSFSATLVDRHANHFRSMPPVTGSGCHPRRHIALSRALTEAAQGRLTLISGSRDDLSATRFDENAARMESAEIRADLAIQRARRAFTEAPDFDHSTFEEDLQFEIAALTRAGLGEVVTVNLSKPQYDIAVARVVIPGLEAMCEVPGYVFGARARASLAARNTA